MTSTLVTMTPFPAPRPIPDAYDRHAPTPEAVRAAVRSVLGTTDWASLSWVELITELMAVGRTDVPLSRLVEGHVDAVRICAQAGHAIAQDALYGVWASRSQATGVRATRTSDGLVLDGVIKFASGAGVIDRALVPVWVDDDTHLLVDLTLAELPVDRTAWQSAAMTVSSSHTVEVRSVSVPATAQVGPDDFYLSRPAFFPGGVGVAAVWAGAAARVTDTVQAWTAHGAPTPAKDLRRGRIRIDLAVAGALVLQAAHALDLLLPDPAAAEADRRALQEVSTEARGGVAEAVTRILAESRRLGGAAGLAFDAPLTHALADLDLYVLQQSADGDAAFLAAPPADA